LIRRDDIVRTLAGALEREAWVRAAWLGGSFATGRTDEWSDVDVQAVVEADRVEETFERARAALEGLSPIAHRHRFPEPMWHGHSQEILSLRDADPCHFVDFVVMKRSSGDRLLEPERHGTAAVLFDREGLLAPVALDRPAHAARLRRRLPELRELFFLLQNLTTKAVRRGIAPDAVHYYHAFTVRPLVELLRMRHCPDRFDFGVRYLDRDLPAALAAEIGELVLPRSLDDLEAKRARAERIFRECVDALDRGEWSLPA
jgi:predicted nucleotidyltransferase